VIYKWVLKKTAGWVARYPRASFCVVIGYVGLSFFEVIPVIEIVSDFVVVLSYVLIRLYVAKKHNDGEPI